MKTLFLIFTLLQSAEARVEFSQPDVSSAAQAQSFEYKLYQTLYGETTPTTYMLAGVVCAGVPVSSCVAPIPVGMPLLSGSKFELTARDVVNNSPESSKSLPFLMMFVGVPTNLMIFRKYP